jgi:hypothetical protein
LDIKGVSLTILAGSFVTAGLVIIGWQFQNYVLWMLGPLLGGIIAGLLTKNDSIHFSVPDKSVVVGILSGVLGGFGFIIYLITIDTTPQYPLSTWELVRFIASGFSVFLGFGLGMVGGVVGNGIRWKASRKKD